MNGKIGVLVIHGMGSQDPEFSHPFRDEVSGRLGNKANKVVWQEIHWADVLKTREDQLWTAMNAATEPDGDAIRLDWLRVRRFVIHNFGDAVAYYRQSGTGGVYGEIHQVISDNIAALNNALNDATAPIVVAAHSLGAHMMSNYIWDRQHWNSGPDPLEALPMLTSMITFGCNIPLFSLAFSKSIPIYLPDPSNTNPALQPVSKWLNFLDEDDVLGWPMKTLYGMNPGDLDPGQTKTFNRIEDEEINVGSVLSGWNPAAHGKYWTDNDFTKPVARHLEELIDATA